MNEHPRRWQQLFWLSLCNLLAMTLWFSVTAVIPALEKDWQLSSLDKAWLTISVQLGFAAGALASAIWNLADRFPAPRVMGLAAIVAAVLNLSIARMPTTFVQQSSGFVTVLILRALVGAMLAWVYPVGMKITASWFRQRRGLAIGVMVGALTIGSGGPHLLRALPLDRWLASVWPATSPLPETWRLVLLAASVCALIAGNLSLFCIRLGPWLPSATQFDWSYFARLWKEEPLRRANLGYLGHMFELYAMWTWAPLLLIESFKAAKYSSWSASCAAFASVAIGGVGCFIAGLVADRKGRCFTTIISLVLSGGCALVAGSLIEWPVALTVVCLLWGFSVIADSAQFSAAVSELADPRYVGTALAIQTSVGFLLTTITIAALPLLQEQMGWPLATAMLAIGPVVGIWQMWRLRALPEAKRLAGGNR